MYQPSSKKQRRKSPARTQQQPTSYLARMKQLKDSEYTRLNNGHTEVLKVLSNNSSNVNASILAKNLPMSQNATTDVIRHGMYEYARVARLIDLAFDTTLHRGKVMGMGSNEGCQLMPLSTDGNDDDDDDDDDFVSNSNIPPTFVLTREIRAVSAGGLHSMALATNGTPYTWGNSSKGVLGTITDLLEGNPLHVTGFHTTYQNSQENICEDGMIHQIAAGDAHSLFLSINGNVYQCGVYLDAESNDFSDDDSKKVVDGNTDKKNGIFGFNQKPVHVYQLPKKVITISASRDFNAAILEDHTLVTWGVNTDGALARIGEGEFDGQTSYVDIVTDANGNHEKKIKTTGIIEQHFLRPKPVMFAHRPTITPKVIEVACGLTHILVIARDPTSPVGNLYTSGLNCSGQLGHGDTVSRNVLALVEAKKNVSFAQVAAGDCFSLALTHNRDVLYSFGRCDYGQLGIGLVRATAERFYADPQVVKFPTAVECFSIDAGDRHALALTTDREIYTWGFNEEGATGHLRRTDVPDHVSDIYRPTLLKLDVQPECYPVQCSGGGQHSLFLVRKTDGNFLPNETVPFVTNK